MRDETTIEPALSAAEWEAGFYQEDDANHSMFEVVHSTELADREGHSMFFVGGEWPTMGVLLADPAQIGAVIALANAALPDDDPRKITRETITSLRDAAHFLENRGDYPWRKLAADLCAFADALASYLPPEGT